VDRSLSSSPALHVCGGSLAAHPDDSSCLTKTPTISFPLLISGGQQLIWSFYRMPPDQMAQRIVYSEERALTTTVDNIEHIESTSYDSSAYQSLLSSDCEPLDCGGAIDRCFNNNFETVAARTTLRSSSNTAHPPFLFFSSESAAPSLPSSKCSILLKTRFASA